MVEQSQLEIQLTHEVLVGDALAVFKRKLGCSEAKLLRTSFVGDYIISAYQLWQKAEGREKLAYQLATRGTIRSDAGPNPKNLASYFGFVPIEGNPLRPEEVQGIKLELEELTAH
ncbi:hypothetical protein HY637_02675 [Candidatus Woesearchaeota archaeon]|nr:hypothetical protein [Candidatus Woesearchaeota archaeon]